MAFDAVLFDFHGTLVVAGSMTGWLDQSEAVAGQRVDHAAVLPVLRQVWQRAARRYPDTQWDLDPRMHRMAFEEVLGQESPCSPALATALYDLMPQQWVPAPGAVRLLVRLRAAGCKVGLVSNTALDLRPRLADLGILQHLDDVVLSFEQGLVKPDPLIFRTAAGRLGVAPADCVYVGDTPATDGGAVVTGMTCLLVPNVDDTPRLELAAKMLGCA